MIIKQSIIEMIQEITVRRSSPTTVHQLDDRRFMVCVSSGLCLEFEDQWDAEACLKGLQVCSVLPK